MTNGINIMKSGQTISQELVSEKISTPNSANDSSELLSEKATQRLKDEIDSISSDSPSSAANKIKELSTELTRNGVLPELSLNWVNKNFSALDSSKDGQVSAEEATNYAKASATNKLDIILAAGYSGALQIASREHAPQLQALDKDQMNSLLQNYRNHRFDLRVASALSAGDGAIFTQLDTAQQGVDKADGKISRKDFEKLTESIDTNKDKRIDDTELQSSKFASVKLEDRRAVVDTLQYLSDKENWNSDAIKSMRDGKYLTKDSIMAKLAADEIAITGRPGQSNATDQAQATTSTDYEVKRGDSYWRIAAQDLASTGIQPTDSQIFKRMNEIGAFNGVNVQKHVLHPGDTVKLPKMTA